MANGRKFFCCLIAVVIAGCASSPRQRLLDVSVGMPRERVLDVLGEPVRICAKKCLHAIVWFKRFEVIAVTGAKSDNVRYCGSGMTPIDWNHMPKSVD